MDEVKEAHGAPLNEARVEGSVIEQTRQLVDATVKPTIKTVDIGDGATALVELRHGSGAKVLDPSEFDDWRPAPLFRKERVSLSTLDSLIDYANRFKDSDSVAFAFDNRAQPRIDVVLDYHRGGAVGSSENRRASHTAVFPLPLSDEWQAWQELDGSTNSMSEFARFLEDHIVDVMHPEDCVFSDEQDRFVKTLGGKSRIADPAKLMELATGLSIYEEAEVTQAVKLQSGEGQLTVTNHHKDGQGGNLIVPSMFVIAIPVFKDGEPYQMVVRLRYRKTGAGVVFIYELWRDDKVFDHAFNEACDKLADQTGLPLFRGSRCATLR